MRLQMKLNQNITRDFIPFLIIAFGLLLNCSKHKNQNSLTEWILLLNPFPSTGSEFVQDGLDVENPPPDSIQESTFDIYSGFPVVWKTGQHFELYGRNLQASNVESIFGPDGSKFFSFDDVSENTILGTVVSCPNAFDWDSKVRFPNNNQSEIVCLDSLPVNYRVLKKEMGVPFEKTPLLMVHHSHEFFFSFLKLGETEYRILESLPLGLSLDQKTGELSGSAREGTENTIREYTLQLRLKDRPDILVEGKIRLLIVTSEEKLNRTCRPLQRTSTCNFSSPYHCDNAPGCRPSLFNCLMDDGCGFQTSD